MYNTDKMCEEYLMLFNSLVELPLDSKTKNSNYSLSGKFLFLKINF